MIEGSPVPFASPASTPAPVAGARVSASPPSLLAPVPTTTATDAECGLGAAGGFGGAAPVLEPAAVPPYDELAGRGRDAARRGGGMAGGGATALPGRYVSGATLGAGGAEALPAVADEGRVAAPEPGRTVPLEGRWRCCCLQ